ncbi:hypothetical protein ACIA03_08560 [Nocardioides sp. NPDC051685]|uniref:hypothetical protein n=1 Tax=Nocardioides sp. NPDC051685 TaxID=3364334 RepID=UPI00379A0014
MKWDPKPILKDLMGFQQKTVDHVIDQFYGAPSADRFLVADETGLGKTMVARGVIARAIEALHRDESVDRIDVVYVCANADLASQNLRKLNVTGDKELEFTSRLTMLASHSHQLNRESSGGKLVNLISFTPGTSFDMGHSLGMAHERAMILLVLEDARVRGLTDVEHSTLLKLFQGGVSTPERFGSIVDDFSRWGIKGELDPAITAAFRTIIESERPTSSLAELDSILAEAAAVTELSGDLRARGSSLVRRFRAQLAEASVDVLEPDLVILDEFQRFRHLLDPNTPAGELAHHLFNHRSAKVLLLSATPYKPYTMAGEDDEDHARDLFATLSFLAEGRNDADVGQIRSDLRRYREAVIANQPSPDIVSRLRDGLLKLMTRAERPLLPDGSMLVERVASADDIRPEDLAGYAGLSRVARLVAQTRDHGLFSTEYWKSAPYFGNFCDGYQLGRRLHAAETSDELTAASTATQRISSSAIRKFRNLDPGNARLRNLHASTIGKGWAELLWVSPSLPYLEPAGPFAEPGAEDMTKQLVFSSWTATPTAVASILSYEAERELANGTNYEQYTPESRKRLARHLSFAMDGDKPASWSTLLMHWPMPHLAPLADPLVLVRDNGGVRLDDATLRTKVRQAIVHAWTARLRDRSGEPGADSDATWEAVLSSEAAWPYQKGSRLTDGVLAAALLGQASELEDEDADGSDPTAAAKHIAAARARRYQGETLVDRETLDEIVAMALFSPANIAFRSLRRLAETDEVSGWGLWRAAATLGNGLRSLFNRPDAIKLIERLALAGDKPYWHQVLRYCEAGNLEAVLDEYLHILRENRRPKLVDDTLLLEIAQEAAAALALRTATYRARNLTDRDDPITFVPRFALRYGGRDQDAEDVRQPEVRRSFNSPFWPMVLASTSVGQEGIDFHWWCHSVFHWNTPPNPVDFEQREGRVDRYRGHAIRRNIADRHGALALQPGAGHPWDRLYDAATDERTNYGDFAPGWVYPGPSKIERHVAPLPLSSDRARYERVRRDVSLYRLTFGQPRQEDMLELLKDDATGRAETFRISLAPPESADISGSQPTAEG